MKHSILYLGLVLPSGGWQSLIEGNEHGVSNSEYFKINFAIARQIADPILQIVKSNQRAICLYLFATNLNTDKPRDIQSRPNINEY